ncbi:phosphatase PAP2 family protein [Neobacillus dielmonensis]|uniref:phosphatase PAP2 family protein n=1 Tax=Neobacillus dielmonensis TaxID=1347369 RepID=UPI0005AA783C|nr:phosphatase PAP2 family protein [Neobacillus dielmonensis]
MRLRLYLSIAFAISVVCLICFSILSLQISENSLLSFDSKMISLIQGLETPWLTVIMKFFTFVGSAPIVILLCLICLYILYKLLHHYTELILFVSVVLGSALLNQLLKQIFHRARPDLHRLVEISGYSFPSGHAMNAFTVYGILAFLLWKHQKTKWRRVCLIVVSTAMILLIGMSRIYLGVHYPTDIIGGYLASGVWVTTAILFFQYYKEKRYNRKYKLDG